MIIGGPTTKKGWHVLPKGKGKNKPFRRKNRFRKIWGITRKKGKEEISPSVGRKRKKEVYPPFQGEKKRVLQREGGGKKEDGPEKPASLRKGGRLILSINRGRSGANF